MINRFVGCALGLAICLGGSTAARATPEAAVEFPEAAVEFKNNIELDLSGSGSFPLGQSDNPAVNDGYAFVHSSVSVSESETETLTSTSTTRVALDFLDYIDAGPDDIVTAQIDFELSLYLDFAIIDDDPSADFALEFLSFPPSFSSDEIILKATEIDEHEILLSIEATVALDEELRMYMDDGGTSEEVEKALDGAVTMGAVEGLDQEVVYQVVDVNGNTKVDEVGLAIEDISIYPDLLSDPSAIIADLLLDFWDVFNAGGTGSGIALSVESITFDGDVRDSLTDPPFSFAVCQDPSLCPEPPVVATPEPMTLLMLGLGGVPMLIGACRRRRAGKA